jgi:hypothetical protein
MEAGETSRLVQLTAGLPQVVHAIGARLASRPGWSLATAVKRFGGRGPALPQTEYRMIEGPYESALRDLSPDQARALRLLAVPEGPDISLSAAAAVLERTVDETESLLESLADVHLLEPGGDDRYGYLTPIRQYARGHAFLEDGEAECHAALVRLAWFYADGLRDVLLVEGPGDAGLPAEVAQTWLLEEQENLWALASQTKDIPDAPAEELTQLIGQAWQGPVTEAVSPGFP